VIEFEKCTDVALALASRLAQPFTRIANAVTRQSAGADTATDILRLRLKHLAVLLNTSKTLFDMLSRTHHSVDKDQSARCDLRHMPTVNAISRSCISIQLTVKNSHFVKQQACGRVQPS
jgi:hypothetical protein